MHGPLCSGVIAPTTLKELTQAFFFICYTRFLGGI